jgi:antitoxin CptB
LSDGPRERKDIAQIAETDPIMAAQNQAGEDIAMRRRRLRYRAWHRGTREMDLILGPYADRYIETLNTGALDRLEALMEEQDTDLLEWILGQTQPPEGSDIALIDQLRAFRQAQSAQQ